MIAVNWGTTNFRAYRLREGGAIADERSSARGVLSVEPGGFPQVLYSEIRDWLDLGDVHVLLAGMVGSRQGWQEVPYVQCPAGIEELSRAITSVSFDFAETAIVPGISCLDVGGVPEMMRGEESEIVGILESCVGAETVCLPGTHSKWVTLDRGRVAGFVTYMTGEVYAALKDHTILSRLMCPGTPNGDSFHEDLKRSQEIGGLLDHLFGVRSLVLAGRMAEERAASYLSGLLIGHRWERCSRRGLLSIWWEPVFYAARTQQQLTSSAGDRRSQTTVPRRGDWPQSEGD